MEETFIRFPAHDTHFKRTLPGSARFAPLHKSRRFEAKGTWGKVGTSLITAMKHVKAGAYTSTFGSDPYMFKVPDPAVLDVPLLPRGGNIMRVVARVDQDAPYTTTEASLDQ